MCVRNTVQAMRSETHIPALRQTQSSALFAAKFDLELPNRLLYQMHLGPYIDCSKSTGNFAKPRKFQCLHFNTKTNVNARELVYVLIEPSYPHCLLPQI